MDKNCAKSESSHYAGFVSIQKKKLAFYEGGSRKK